ncbi:hypothetical protein JM83_0221 [Gillisia sp. Hel_I_86]|nr:hypothetical protein JM83_0221 [Gillisia sp. Hel_I_86]
MNFTLIDQYFDKLLNVKIILFNIMQSTLYYIDLSILSQKKRMSHEGKARVIFTRI